MILEKQPRAFVIAIKNHAVSEIQLQDCLDSAKKFNWTVEVFWGVNGFTVNKNTWAAQGLVPRLDKPTMSKPGVQGCFLSHYSLWKKCIELDEPIIILEHDAVIQQPWNTLKLTKSIIKLHRQYSKKNIRSDLDSGVWSKSAHAYCLAPAHANTLIQFVKRVGAYEVDILMGTNVIPVEYLKPSWVERQNTYSTTENL